jgi:hypothetical protein
MKYLLSLLVTAILLSSCEKKELPAPAFDRGDVITNQVDMGPTYKNQIWFSLSENRIMSSNLKSDWDLAFEAGSTGNHIMLNGSKGMKVYKTSHTDLAQVTDTLGLGFNSKADAPSGKLDSTAFEGWESLNTVYVIDRGYDEAGLHEGFYKMKLTSVTASHFTFEFGDIFGTQISQGTVNKQSDYNFVMYSFRTGYETYIEPKKTDYDLCFTVYTHYFTNPFQYYQVTGVLQNQYQTKVMRIKDKPFADIVLSDTTGRVFFTDRNSIGYEWKTFSLNTNLYAIDPTYCYIIHDSKGFYYKLHFVDFYNTSGIKGFPKFEFKRL